MKHTTVNLSEDNKIEKFMEALNPNMITEEKGILYFNTGIYSNTNGGLDNAMPQFMIQLQKASSIHASLTQLKYGQILGNNLDIKDNENPIAIELAAFINKRNLSGDNVKTVYAKAAKDYSIFEAAAIQVLYDRNGKIANIYHIPVENVRMGIPNAYGAIENYYISRNFADITNARYKKKTLNNSAVRVHVFDPTQYAKYPVQLLYISSYSPSTFYAVPNYLSATDWILLDNAISRFNLQSINSSYFQQGMLVQQGNPTPEEMSSFIADFQSLYKGIGQGNSSKEKMLFSWVDQMAEKPEFISFAATLPDFDKLLNKCEEKIIYGHSGFAEAVGKQATVGSLGNDGGKSLYVAIESYTQLICNNMKNTLVDGFNRLFEVNGYDNLLTVETDAIRTTQPTPEVSDLSLEERRYMIYGLDTQKDTVDTTSNKIIDQTPT